MIFIEALRPGEATMSIKRSQVAVSEAVSTVLQMREVYA
jgi:hypothetical protein